jgi:hypothetical protein
VRTDLEDLVTALHITIDDLLGPRLAPRHPPTVAGRAGLRPVRVVIISLQRANLFVTASLLSP